MDQQVPLCPRPMLNFGFAELQVPARWNVVPNAAIDEIRDRAIELLVRVGAFERDSPAHARFAGLDLAALSARIYVDAPAERLAVCNDIMSYFFLLDDQADADPEIGKRPERLWQLVSAHMFALRFGKTVDGGDGPLTRLILDVHRRLVELGDAGWLSRFATNMRNYAMEGTVSAAVNWAQMSVPEPAAYVAARQHDVAGFPAQDLIEFAGGFCLPAAVLEERGFRELQSICTRVVAWTNDLVSYPQEFAVGNPNNLIEVLRTHTGKTPEEAARQVVRQINADLNRFEHVAQNVAGCGEAFEATLEAYVHGQRCLISGNLVWSRLSQRYRCGSSSRTHPSPVVGTARSPERRTVGVERLEKSAIVREPWW